MSTLIGAKCVVSINYKLSDAQGETLDQSQDGEPLTYLHGAAGILPGLEKELAGKSTGDNFDVTISPDEAYGEHKSELIQIVPMNLFPDTAGLVVGHMVNGQSEEGAVQAMITAIDKTAETVTLDGNHPLAGKTLRFEGSVDNVREATEEELSHGHAH
jgi:FKBP-type peptidyl-prolyl cis-trans isomerase SlyD